MIFNQISEVYSFFKTLLESNFITALVGAGAGAIGAQFLAQKITTRELLIKEIRNVNSAISTTTHICFSFLAIKANATRVMHEKFFKDRQNFVEFLNHGQEIRDFDYFRDCGLIIEPQVNIENLQKLIFNNLSLDQKAVSAFVFLEESIKLFSTSLSGRNKITEMHLLNYKNYTDEENDVETLNYFGLDHDGGSNSRYLNFVNQILLRNDDCIFLAMDLIGKLIKHGKPLKKKYGKKAPDIFEPNFAKAFYGGLFPNNTRYEKWEFT